MAELRILFLMLFGVLFLVNAADAADITIISAQGCIYGGSIHVAAQLTDSNGDGIANAPIDLTIYDVNGKDLIYPPTSSEEGTTDGDGYATWDILAIEAGTYWFVGTYDIVVTAVVYPFGDVTKSGTIEIMPKPTPTPTPTPKPTTTPKNGNWCGRTLQGLWNMCLDLFDWLHP